ncbi:hypothetical protein M2418_001170 [Rhizobium sp. BIGb0125]|uniref:hypothetical protein n=1 Tax=Rhizobium sp. BIGb0125 TaxID=2940618 RepID=UPI00216A0318|nr:hypothetical protein [Rhizobium sp. BIGb0125]MCS4241659.1 hypothetical protein [Rhizobium sp. BIGb0125]
MKRLSLALLLLAAVSMASCQREDHGDIAKLSGRMFVFNYRVASANYLVTLQPLAPITAGSTAEVEFENPRGGAPLSTVEKLFPKTEKIVLQSPPIECVKKGRPYKVTIRLKDADGLLRQTIKTSISSNTDQSLLPAKPLVVGPLYTPNPDVFRSDGTTDMSPVQGCPK